MKSLLLSVLVALATLPLFAQKGAASPELESIYRIYVDHAVEALLADEPATDLDGFWTSVDSEIAALQVPEDRFQEWQANGQLSFLFGRDQATGKTVWEDTIKIHHLLEARSGFLADGFQQSFAQLQGQIARQLGEDCPEKAAAKQAYQQWLDEGQAFHTELLATCEQKTGTDVSPRERFVLQDMADVLKSYLALSKTDRDLVFWTRDFYEGFEPATSASAVSALDKHWQAICDLERANLQNLFLQDIDRVPDPHRLFDPEQRARLQALVYQKYLF